ncbi:hypothetical protein ABPG77_002658 [Micractinium sp. CCAP 211/92]
MLRLATCLAALAVLLAASPAAAFMTKCQRSCVGKPYSPTCVAWTFEGPRSGAFPNECFAHCMIEDNPTAHITQWDMTLPEACARQYAEYGYWLGNIEACFVCRPPTGASDGLPAEGPSLSLSDEDFGADEDALEPIDDLDLIVEPIDGGDGQLERAVEQGADEAEQKGRRLARRLLA